MAKISLRHVGCTTNAQLNPAESSASRVQMQGVHYTQAPPIWGAEPPAIFTGVEREYAKYMFDIKVERDCKVIRIIERRPKAKHSEMLSDDGWPPGVIEICIIVELANSETTGTEVDIINVPKYISNHKDFGFPLELTDIGLSLHEGQYLSAGDIIAKCKSIIDDEWCLGVNANTILASHPGSIEDSMVISQELADKMTTWGYNTYVISVGEKGYPLFLYGDDDNPRILPNIGEKVREDGLLFARRKIDPILGAIDLMDKSIRNPCGHYDHCTYVEPGSEVIDIHIERDDVKARHYGSDGLPVANPKMESPTGIQIELDSHAESLSNFYGEFRNLFNQLGGNRRDAGITYTPIARQRIIEAIRDNPSECIRNETRVLKQFNYELIDDYRITITIRYPIPFRMSSKLTDTMGGKGVAGRVVPTNEMPIDEYGNRVHAILAANAMLRRTNFNRGTQLFLNAAARDHVRRTHPILEEQGTEAAFDYLMDFVDIVTPTWADALRETHPTKAKKLELLKECFAYDGIRLHITPDNVYPPDVVRKNVADKYPPIKSKLTYTNDCGEVETTTDDFLVGKLNLIRLERIGNEYSATATARFQSFGTIARRHASDRTTRPISEKGIRFMGESEYRHLSAHIPTNITAKIHDLSNNPRVCREVVKSILYSDTPTNIENIVDRDKFPLGNNSVLNIIDHIMGCRGFEFVMPEENYGNKEKGSD